MRLFKQYFIILLLILTSILLANSITEVKIFVNTIDKNEIQVFFNLKNSIDINGTLTTQKNKKILFKVKELETDATIFQSSDETAIWFGRKSVRFTIVPLDKDIINKIYSKEKPIYIEADSDIEVHMPEGQPSFILKREIIKDLSSQSFSLSERQKELLLSASGGTQIELKNSFDFSKRISNSDSTKSEYVFNFDFIERIAFNPYNIPLFIKLKGSISDRVKNPLNRTEMFLIGKMPGLSSLNFEIGRVGNQDFSRNAVQLSLSYETLIANLIDLTKGHTRLRLKPYIKAGLSFIKNYQKDNPYGDKDFNLKLFAESYYYIPVSEKFALILEGEVSYSDGYEDDEKYRYLYNITFGYDLPLKDLKILFKIQSGQNDIYINDDTRLLAGLLFNFFEF